MSDTEEPIEREDDEASSSVEDAPPPRAAKAIRKKKKRAKGCDEAIAKPIEARSAKPAAPEKELGKNGHAKPTKVDESEEATSPDAADDESSEEESASDALDDREDVLLPEGNPLRARGLAPLLGGLLVAFVVMSLGRQYRYGVPIGALALAVATFGLLDVLGSFDDADARVAKSTKIQALGSPIALLASGAASLWAFVTLAVDGRLAFLGPGSAIYLAGLLVPTSFVITIAGGFRLLEALGVFEPPPGEPRLPMHRRHGFWLLVLMALVYLPSLGSHSLSDPWETHYGEVSREILARNDWISLWWAQEGWFWSKPILDFWIQALAMATFGVRYGSDRMLSAVAEGREPWPEWAVRLPVFLLTAIGVYLLYKAVARTFGRRAGFFGGVVLLTMPQWFLVTHQTMTDMPFVATMAAAMALALLGLAADPNEEAKAYEIDFGALKLRVSLFHVVLGAIALAALPQILYLFSRNLEIRTAPFDLHAHADVFQAGSPGNCSLPNNEACHSALPVLSGLHPSLQALLWTQALALLVYMNWGERRVQRLLFLGAWFFCALSTMAKGPAGLGLPVLATLGYLFVSRRFKDLLKMETAGGTLILLAVAFPWFVAMYARHGQPFTDRLFFHDMFKRAFTHVHDTNEGDDVSFRYYVWQLGYAMFPWVGLAPAALVAWLRRDEDHPKAQASAFLGTWFVVSFALFSLMLTKFHHYILPAVPAAGMLVGIYLDDLSAPAHPIAADDDAARANRALHFVGLGLGVALAIVGVARFVKPFVLKQSTEGAWVGAFATALGALAIVLTVRWFAPREREDVEPASFAARHARAVAGVMGVAGALVVMMVGRDLAEGFADQPLGQIRLFHLFTYNYKRPWPASLDERHVLWAFALVAATTMLLLVVTRLRRHVVPALLAIGVLFATWGLDVYMMRTSPHWGQREIMLAYYRAAREQPGPIVSYQQNWKGENFYTGNFVPSFVSSGRRFTDWVLEEKKKGVKTFYFACEHGRVTSLQNELGSPRIFEKLTTPELNNKFLIVRATFD